MFSVDEKNNVRMIRGDTGYLKVRVTDNGVPYKLLDGEQLVLEVAQSISKQTPAIQKTSMGVFRFAPEDTQHCDFFKYRYKVTLVRANGDRHTIVPWAYFEIISGVN